MSTPRARGTKPALKPSKLFHKPRVPSRLSLSSLPPLPVVAPSTSDSLVVDSSPATPRDLERCRSRSPSRSSGPKLRRPSPPPRRSRHSREDAVRTVGAVYIGWGTAKGDPAPLCCPVAKEKMKARFGEASIGWMSTPSLPSISQIPVAQLPPLPTSTSPATHDAWNVSTPSPTCQASPSLSPPSLVLSDSPSPASTASITSPFPFDLSAALSDATSPATSTSLLPYHDTVDLTLALPLPSDQRDFSCQSHPSSPRQPSSETLYSIDDLVPALPSTDAKLEDDAMSEHLWSSSESFFCGTDLESEASWAW
ncbi:hypothetical protein JCM10212_005417 [Sporobolomyces blumeae]